MATDILGLETDYTIIPKKYTGPQTEMVHGALEAQGMASLLAMTADFPNGGVFEIPDDTSWAVSASGVISPGMGIATHTTYKALALQTTANVTVTDATPGFEASASGLYLYATIEVATNDSRKTRVPKFVLSDSATYNGGILIASGITTDTDSITAATDARTFITFAGGGASTPTGTGLVKVVSGVQDAAASLIVNADVDAAAAIAQSKIANLTTDLAAKSASSHTHSAATTSAAGFMSAADKLKLDNATDANTASAIVKRDSSGNFKSAAPVASSDVATKGYADGLVAVGAADADESTKGITKLSVAPVSDPIAVGDNDSRVAVMGASGAGHSAGIVDDPGASAGSTRYWREDAVWATPAGVVSGGTTGQIYTKSSGTDYDADWQDAPAGGVTTVSGTAPIVSSGGSTPAISISAATTGAAGSMSAADKTKLDGVATSATANDTDANLKNRANHTGTQAQSTVVDLVTDLAAKQTTGNLSNDMATDTGSTTKYPSVNEVEDYVAATTGGVTAPITASEALTSGNLVNLWNDGGTLKARKASSSDIAKRAHGYVTAAVSSSATATVKFSGINDQITGATPGDAFLGASGAVGSTRGADAIGQHVGVALSATELLFVPGEVYEL